MKCNPAKVLTAGKSTHTACRAVRSRRAAQLGFDGHLQRQTGRKKRRQVLVQHTQQRLLALLTKPLGGAHDADSADGSVPSQHGYRQAARTNHKFIDLACETPLARAHQFRPDLLVR